MPPVHSTAGSFRPFSRTDLLTTICCDEYRIAFQKPALLSFQGATTRDPVDLDSPFVRKGITEFKFLTGSSLCDKWPLRGNKQPQPSVTEGSSSRSASGQLAILGKNSAMKPTDSRATVTSSACLLQLWLENRISATC